MKNLYRITLATILFCTISTFTQAQVIFTVAGTTYSQGYAGDGNPATSSAVMLSNPTGVAVDKNGNIYIADYSNAVIRKVTKTTGLISTFAGNGSSGYSDGTGTSVQFYGPVGVAIDTNGNVYVADQFNQRIRKITPTGVVTTIAGTGTAGFSGDGGSATAAQFSSPTGITVDTLGNVYIADQNNYVIRKITASTGKISTVAGIGGTSGSSGDGGPATAATLSTTEGVAVDKFGNIYIADGGNSGNNRIRKVTASTGFISTIAGNGTAGFSGDGGPATAAQINNPFGVAVTKSGVVYFTDEWNADIREIKTNDTIQTIAGQGYNNPDYAPNNIAANTAYLANPTGICTDKSGNVYFDDEDNYLVREINTTSNNITVQPHDTSTCNGLGAGFSVTVSGTGNTYLWLVDSNYSNVWDTITNNSQYSGATTNTLTIQNASNYSGYDYQYQCNVNGGYEYSNVVNLYPQSPYPVNLIGPGDSVCPGVPTSITANASGGEHPTRYHVMVGEYGLAVWNNGDSTNTISVSPTVTTTYSVAVTFDYCTVDTTITVQVDRTKINPVAFPSANVCAGNSITLYGQGGNGGYSWSGGINNNEGFSPAATKTYTVTGIDGMGCVLSDSVKVVVNALPVISYTATPSVVCSGNSVILSGSGAVSYNWSGGVTDGVSFVPISSTDYTLTGTAANGCSNSISVPITVNPLPVVTGTASPGAVCSGSSVTLSGNGAASYSWSGGVTNAVPFIPATSGTYTVTGTSAAGCVNTAAVSVTVDPLPAITASAFPAATLCQGSSLALFGGGGASYSWSGGANNGVSFTPSSSVTYTVTGIDANGCKNKDSILVKVFNKVVPIITSANTSCGMKNGMASVSASNGIPPYTYSWSTSPAKYSSSIDSLAAGTYVVSVSDSANCASTVAVSIGGSTAPILSVSSTNSNCGSVGTGSASVLVTGGTAPYHYMWNNGDTLTNDYNLKAATYIITVTDVNGCSTFAPAIVSNNNGPKITTSSIVNIKCYGASSGAINVSVTGGVAPYQYTWSNGSSSASIGSLFAGPYQLTVMDADSCTSVESFIITQPAAATSIVSSSAKADCGLNDGSASVVVTGGLAPYHYLWNTGVTSAADVSIGAGVYVVTVTDANGCIDSAHVSVSDKTGPALVLSLASNAACGSGGLLSVAASGATAPYTYLWSDGNTNTSISNVPAGNYNVTVTDAHGCISSADTTVSEATPPAIAICMVTVDPITSKYNYVIWDKSSAKKIVSYNIYKETTVAGVYQKIASVPFSALGVYTDSLSAPTVRSWRYEITQVDSCGNESPMSLPHKTMHLTVNQGVGNNINLIWDNYQGLAFSTYYVYRDTIGTNFTVIDSIPNNIFTYTDNNPPVTKKPLLYRIGISNPGGCTPSIEAVNYNASKSNTGNVTFIPSTVSVQNITSPLNTLEVYPNPNTGLFTFTLQLPNNAQNLSLSVINTLGQTIYTQSYSRLAGAISKQVDLSDFAKGVYFLKLTTNNSVVYKKVVIQ